MTSPDENYSTERKLSVFGYVAYAVATGYSTPKLKGWYLKCGHMNEHHYTHNSTIFTNVSFGKSMKYVIWYRHQIMPAIIIVIALKVA